MSIHSIAANTVPAALRGAVPQFQPTMGAQPKNNPAYRADSASFGDMAPQFRIYSPIIEAQKNENWRITDYYPFSEVSAEEISSMLSEISQEIRDADFTGKTNIEKYDWIENKYVERFGKDFMLAYSLQLEGMSEESKALCSIGAHFKSSVAAQFRGSPVTPQQVNRERLYGGMSVTEIQNTIREKYPMRLTNRDFMLLMEEMDSVGVCGKMAGALNNYVHITSVGFDKNGALLKEATDYDKWISKLNKPADLAILFGDYNIDRAGILSSRAYGRDELEFLVNALGATLRRDGFLEPCIYELWNVELEWDVEYHVPDLEEEYLSDLDKHLNNLARIREVSNEEHEKKRVKAYYEDNALTPPRKAGNSRRVNNSEIKRTHGIQSGG